MLGDLGTRRIFARARPTDLRKSFNGLSGLVVSELGRDLLTGDLFLFVNRTRTSAKVLLWDGTGLCVYAKRLAKGRFAALWGDMSAQTRVLTRAELALFLEGAIVKRRT